MNVNIDLHIHTLLSPCAGIEMIPVNIVRKALEMGDDIIAITDHNAVGNISSVIRAGLKYAPDIVILPGIEITSREEVHILGIFSTIEDAYKIEKVIHNNLSVSYNKDYIFDQLVVDEEANFLRYEEHFLLGATSLTIEEIVALIHSLGGIAIPAHIDRESFGLIYTLGFFPTDLNVDAVEISKFATKEKIVSLKEMLSPDMPIIFSSDAHFLEDFIKPRTVLSLEERSFTALRMALRSLHSYKEV
ncbi:MAG: PHP domain-containing protein [bacterium]